MFKVLDEVCQPTRATKYSAMVDLYAREDVVIGAGETKIVPLGVKIDLNILLTNWNWSGHCSDSDKDWFMKHHLLELHPRSSLRAKGLIIGVGVIDLDYPDEIGLIVHNPQLIILEQTEDETEAWIKNGRESFTINKGGKIAQCTLKEHKGFLLGIESDTERTGGFGSTN